jgi:cyclopropane fatty-acyl-phospholipid synthase-like methyltransferase
MERMSPADFEALYRASPDPWGYTTSEYERRKYDATLRACGGGPFSDALELGCSIGVFTSLLAPSCERLTTIDAAPTAVAAARRRLAGATQVDVILGEIPDAIPIRDFDLVVASEVLYYLTAPGLARTVQRLESTMVAGARLVAVHWRPGGPERPLDARKVHAILREQPWLERVSTNRDADEYRLDVLERM